MSKELEARLERLEAVVGGLLNELSECKQALQGAETHLARSVENLAYGQFTAQRQASLYAQLQNAQAMSQATNAAAQGNLSSHAPIFSGGVTQKNLKLSPFSY